MKHPFLVFFAIIFGWAIVSSIVEKAIDLKLTTVQVMFHDLPAFVAGYLLAYYFSR